MQKVTVQQARKDISRLLDAVAVGETVVIMRRGKPVANLTAVSSVPGKIVKFPNRDEFRHRLPTAKISSAQLIREIREEKY